VAVARQVTPTSSIAEWQGEAGQVYQLLLGLQSGASPTPFDLGVTFPRP
jgi:hypothetical protein